MSGIRGQQVGGKARSLADHQARATYRPDRHRHLTAPSPAPVPSVTLPARAPAGLSASSRTLWRKLMQEYEINSVAQIELLATALHSRDIAERARETLRTEGLTTLDRHGKPRAHPAATILRDQQAAYVNVLRVLGFPGAD